MSSQTPIWQYQNSANGGISDDLNPARNKPSSQALPKPLPQQLQMSRPQQHNLLQQHYYTQGKLYDSKFPAPDTQAGQVAVAGAMANGTMSSGSGVSGNSNNIPSVNSNNINNIPSVNSNNINNIPSVNNISSVNNVSGHSNSVSGHSNSISGHSNSVSGHSNSVSGHSNSVSGHSNSIPNANSNNVPGNIGSGGVVSGGNTGAVVSSGVGSGVGSGNTGAVISGGSGAVVTGSGVGNSAAPPNMSIMRGIPQSYQVPMHGYGVGPGEIINNNFGNFQMHADQWDQFAMGVRHPSSSGTSGPGGPGIAVGPVASVTGMSQLAASNVPEKKPRVRAHGSHGSLSSDSQDENGTKDSEYETEPPHVSGNSGKVAKRSRMGCLTCRQRKKRCCETRPKCTECLRLRLSCTWPKPGTEHKNKPKEVKSEENTIEHDIYGKIKVLRGIVEYRSDQ